MADAKTRLKYEDELIEKEDGSLENLLRIRVFDGPLSCHDVNYNYDSLSLAADASNAGYARCEGCVHGKPKKDWDIEQLEINDSYGPWGHYTLYGKSTAPRSLLEHVC